MTLNERTTILAATFVVVALGLGASVLLDTWRGFYFPMSEGVLAVATVIAGAIITKAQPQHAVGRILLWAGFIAAMAQLLAVFADGPVSDPAASSGVIGAAVSLFQFSSLTMLTALIARFPDGTWTTKAARRLFIVFVGLVMVHLGLLVASATGIAPASEGLDGARSIAFRLIPWVGLALTLHVVVHLLRSDATRRRQIGLVLAAFAAALVPEALVEGLDLEPGPIGGLARGLVVALIPASVVVAVTRYRLYEIDRVVSRTVSYAIVLGAMVLVYLTVFLGLASLVDLSGNLEVAIATLAAVAVSFPLVRRVRLWVDRRFFRNRYDSARVVARVAEELRTIVDLEHVEHRAEAVIEEVFAPEEVSVWLAERTAP